MIALLLILNFAISWLNAWGCGKAWNETKHVGGFAHFMNWMGAIMSACGFTWCFMFVLAFIGSALTYDPATYVIKHEWYVVTPEAVKYTLELGYMVVILPIIGSGLAITMDSWAYFYHKRTVGSGLVAGYNTLADAYNIYTAARAIPAFSEDLGKMLWGDKDDNKSAIVILLVAVALVGGILLTRKIILATAASTATARGFAFEAARSQQRASRY
jgi:hypothetical protein